MKILNADIGAIGLLVVGACAYFAPALPSDQIIYGSDMPMNYPILELVADNMRAGTLPFWSPYVSSGTPLFPFVGLFYPSNLLFLILPVNQGLTVSFVLHLIIAGIGTLFFLRQVGASFWGALLGSFVFMLNSHLVLRIFAGHVGYVYAAAWIPWTFWFLERILSYRRLRDAAGCGLALGVQLLSGLFQIAIYTWLLFALYAGLRWMLQYRGKERRDPRTVIHSGVLCALALVLGVGLSAIYWLPAQASVGYSLRQGLTYAEATIDSLPPTHLITLFLPEFFGSDRDHNYWGYFLGAISQSESGLYIGLLPMIFAILALFDSKRMYPRLWLGLMLSVFILAFGRFTPIYRLLYDFVPGMNAVRIPARILILACFFLACLAGLGFSFLESRLNDVAWRRRLMLVLGGLALVSASAWLMTTVFNPSVTWLAESLARFAYERAAWEHTRPLDYTIKQLPGIVTTLPQQFVPAAIWLGVAAGLLAVGGRRKRLVLALLLLLVALDLFGFASRYLVIRPVAAVVPSAQTELLAYHTDPAQTGRVFGEGLIPTYWGNVWGFANVQGGTPFTIERYWALSNYGSAALPDRGTGGGLFQIVNPRTLNLLNVTTAFTLNPIGAPEWKEIAQRQVETWTTDRVLGDSPMPRQVIAHVSKNTDALPRAFVVYDSQVIADDALALQTLDRPDFDPARQVILDQPVGALGPATGLATAHIQTYAPNQLAFEVTTDAPGLLVLSEIFAPGWSATLDGQPTTVLRADYALRGIYVLAGKHQIEMNYMPPGLSAGFGITLGTAFILVAVGLFSIWRKPARGNGAT